MRAKPIMMPPARGMAPPLRPVPAPRPTSGNLCCAASFTMAETSAMVRGKDHDIGAGFIDAAIVFVESEVVGPVKQGFFADDVDRV